MAAIAEDLLLLLLDDFSGRPVVDGTSLDNALAGALLLDLVESGRVSPAGPGDPAKAGRLLVRDASPIGDDVLNRALVRLAAKAPLRGQRAVEVLAKNPRLALLDALAQRGLIRPEKNKLFGLFTRTSWPAANAGPKEAVRARLIDVLLNGHTADAHSGGLVSLLYAIDALHKVLPGTRTELRARAKAVDTDAWAGDAVKKSVQAVQAAVMAAVFTATAVTVTSGGG